MNEWMCMHFLLSFYCNDFCFQKNSNCGLWIQLLVKWKMRDCAAVALGWSLIIQLFGGQIKLTGVTDRCYARWWIIYLDDDVRWYSDSDGIQDLAVIIIIIIIVVVVVVRLRDGLAQSQSLVASVLRRDWTSSLVNARPPRAQATHRTTSSLISHEICPRRTNIDTQRYSCTINWTPQRCTMSSDSSKFLAISILYFISSSWEMRAKTS